ncbi:MAG: hypothetical protein HKN75_11305 [Bacteroidia bacterium]|nr:hypothetical protein [Bacteroidia bacterium]
MQTPRQDNAFINQETGSKKSVIIVIIVILLTANGFLLWQFFNDKNTIEVARNEVVETRNEKNELFSELEQVKLNFENIKSDNDSLQELLVAKDKEIADKVNRINKLIKGGGAWEMRKAKKELNSLRLLSAQYKLERDSLLVVSAQLTSDNKTLNTSLKIVETKANKLEQQNVVLEEKIVEGSVFVTNDLLAYAIKTKASGKEVETSRAGNTDKIRICFTVLKNPLIEQGMQDLFVKVIGPEGSVITRSSEEFTDINGNTNLFSFKTAFDYKKKNTDLCFYWNKESSYKKGNYNVELFNRGAKIGETTLSLK